MTLRDASFSGGSLAGRTVGLVRCPDRLATGADVYIRDYIDGTHAHYTHALLTRDPRPAEPATPLNLVNSDFRGPTGEAERRVEQASVPVGALYTRQTRATLRRLLWFAAVLYWTVLATVYTATVVTETWFR